MAFPARHHYRLYDLKRSAVRDMVRAGVSETVAISITGQKTQTMFRRYNITSQADKENAQRLLLSYREAKKGSGTSA